MVAAYKQNGKKKHAKQNKYMIVKSELDRQRRRPRQQSHYTFLLPSLLLNHRLPHRRTEKTCHCRGKHFTRGCSSSLIFTLSLLSALTVECQNIVLGYRNIARFERTSIFILLNFSKSCVAFSRVVNRRIKANTYAPFMYTQTFAY